ncbi:mannose-6-phosphate isomerase, class I [Micromonospora sp. WMMC241]|uniref:mannose-6-phosphate isomerase, class I n=1 Tax=Micromonospora sp. WMMC241 TaxID=3015159 RepID=UPI0022B5EEEA|nr:mannose-6-phosphate isomerase, class I [Micromonospora sp. WMMC241]MCZ7439634.1 mannose-6-phosphate isomerase, class I [Micromonospora sp. WMMC241]
MELLQGRIRDYAWGSRTAIAELQGRPVPSEGPEAELWLGAHPGAPATVDRDGRPVSLTELLVAEPGHWLGERLVGRFGTRLPFLLKVLAADAPLSLQAHPDAEQARVGHAADDGRVNYVDPYHKPELLVALSEFDALCGFRDPAESAAVIGGFGVPALEPVVAALRTGPAGLREAVRALLSWPEAERAGLVAAVLAAATAGPASPDAALVRTLAAGYPADPGVVVALLLHHVRLAPGDGIWMPAGNLHAYLRGTGVEIMAASDNVLRGGLTPKRVDVDELLRVLRFEVLADPVLRSERVAPGVSTWPVPVEDFALHRVTVSAGSPGVRLTLPGPRVVLCRAGKLSVDDGVGVVTLGAGQSAVGTAAGGALALAGDGEAFVATCGLR